MKQGDLVRCNYQPSSSRYNTKTGCMMPMLHYIKGQLGIIVRRHRPGSAVVYFPQFGYEHPLAYRALELVNEDR